MNKQFVNNFVEWLYHEALSSETAAGMFVEITNVGVAGLLTSKMCNGIKHVIDNPEIKTAYQEIKRVPNRIESGWTLS